jgi:hypothetical protein
MAFFEVAPSFPLLSIAAKAAKDGLAHPSRHLPKGRFPQIAPPPAWPWLRCRDGQGV